MVKINRRDQRSPAEKYAYREKRSRRVAGGERRTYLNDGLIVCREWFVFIILFNLLTQLLFINGIISKVL